MIKISKNYLAFVVIAILSMLFIVGDMRGDVETPEDLNRVESSGEFGHSTMRGRLMIDE